MTGFPSLPAALGACLILGACASPEPPAGAGDGWQSMFDGASLDGWTAKIKGHPLGENFADTFRVVDGAIQVGYEGYEGGFQARFGHLFYETPHTHYLMRLEYRFTGNQCEGGPGWARRNSGVMVHGQPAATMRVEQDFPVSIEVQLLGGDGESKRSTGNLCTPGTNVVMDGELVQRHCTDSTSKTYHGDQWVQCEIEVRGGGVVIHRIEGEEVLRYEQPQLDPRDDDAARLLAERSDGILRGGSISLQSESHPCEFRNLEIKVLSP